MSTIFNQFVGAVDHHQEVGNWYSEENPVVSIVILNFNKANLTIECLESIWEHTCEYRYEIIVVDNGSRDEEIEKLAAFQGAYKLVKLAVNRYFGEGNNIGAELAKGEFLVFMNNDVTVTPGWLSPLMNVFEVHSDCGVAGPKFLYPDGGLQEAGALLDEDGGAVQIGKFQDPRDPRFNKSRVVDYVSAATVLMRKTVFEDVLGFDFIYEPAYYEDVDLCLKIGSIGLKTYYIAESCVVHHENATTSDPSHGLQLNTIVECNRQKFVKRWKEYLTTGRHSPVQEAVCADVAFAAADTTLKTAALYTPYNVNPGGGERYLLSMAEHLIRDGYKTSLVLPETISLLRVHRIASILNVDLSSINVITYDQAQAMPEFDLFVAMGNEIVPPVKALGCKSLYICQFPFPCSRELIESRRDWMAFYDEIIVYSDFAKRSVLDNLRKHALPNLAVQVVSPPVDMRAFDVGMIKENIVSVGRFFVGGHCKQQDMLIRALRRLHQLGVRAELHLVGSLPPEAAHREYLLECQRLAEGLPVHFHVDASEDTLRSLYEKSSVYWHGGGYRVDVDEAPEKCEHFGISVVEAMSAGVIPVVVRNGGPASIVQHGVNGYCYETEDGLVETTLDILSQSPSELVEIRRLARLRAHDFSKAVFSESVTNLLDKAAIGAA
jgi:O-antigen biosynthesis protein